MFTGIIQAVGRIRDNEEIGDGLRIHVEAPELGLDTVKIGAVSYTHLTLPTT